MRNAHVFGLGAVDQVAEDPAAVAAVGIDAALTVVAATARSNAGNQHLVADLDIAHAIADFLNHPHAFVSQNTTIHHSGYVALEDMQIGTADSGMGDAHHRIRGLLDRRLRLIFPASLTGPMKYQCLHDASLLSMKTASSN